MAKVAKVHEPLVHLVKRTETKQLQAWGIRIGAFVLSIFVCAVLSALISENSLGFFFKQFFSGVFGTSQNAWITFHNTAILLIIALAVTPCFKMKFWNIGGEGQVLMGALGCAVAINFMGGKYPDGLTIFVSIIAAIAFGVVWAVIPALFKAKWNTNETLLTLMMNYIATCLVLFFIKSVASTGTGILVFKEGVTQAIAGNSYILKILIVAAVTAFMWVYLRYSKHGYELTVVGESVNTARYIGINTKKVIVRTLVLCGVICGIAGFMLVSATNHSLSSDTVGGRGFTGVLISWLGHFNPIAMTLCSFLVVFITRGASQFSNYARLGASYPSVLVGIFFFFIIATEFFINYKIVFKHSHKKDKVAKDSNEVVLVDTDEVVLVDTDEVVLVDTNDNQEVQLDVIENESQTATDDSVVDASDKEDKK